MEVQCHSLYFESMLLSSSSSSARVLSLASLLLLLGCTSGEAGTEAGPEPETEQEEERWPDCVAEGTLIATPRGAVPVEALQLGDSVISRGPRGRLRENRVVAIRRAHRQVGRIEVAGTHLELTQEHPVFDARLGTFVEAEALATDASLLRLDFDWRGPIQVAQVSVAAPQLVEIDEPFSMSERRAQVFDLTIERDHNYFAAGFLVHNKSPSHPDCGGLQAPRDCSGAPTTREALLPCEPLIWLAPPLSEDPSGMGGGGGGSHSDTPKSPGELRLSFHVEAPEADCTTPFDLSFSVLGEPGARFEISQGVQCEEGEIIDSGEIEESGATEVTLPEGIAGEIIVSIERMDADCIGITEQTFEWAGEDARSEIKAFCETLQSADFVCPSVQAIR